MKKRETKEYEEEKRPFDDVMRQLLQAKPKHREAAKAKPTKWDQRKE